MTLNRPMRPVRTDDFKMVPSSDVPRSTFVTQHTHKTTFQSGYLIPFHCDEVLPGDMHHGEVDIFARLATCLFPPMDQIVCETFFFFVPNRLVWTNWRKMMGEQTNPTDSISYTTPQINSPAGGFPINSIYDYFGLPCVGQVAGGNIVNINALPIRAYMLIYDEWFRDENINPSTAAVPGDGPDNSTSYALQRRNKKHDYFTSCLPWPLKGGVEVPLPISGIVGVTPTTNSIGPVFKKGTGPTPTLNLQTSNASSPAGLQGSVSAAWAAGDTLNWGTTNLQVDLSTAAGATINTLRLSIATQQYLEKNARGGTRYTELLRMHFGVMNEDARLQRPEYIGGGKTQIQTQAIPQTSATGLTGGATPQGALVAQATMNARHKFTLHATEHGWIIGLIHVTADITYQQGLHRKWTRQTRLDHYWPTFANLGEQAVLNREIYCDGSANDANAFGYQERWAEYRHFPGMITGMFNSKHAGAIDGWHLAQNFTGLPTLGPTFLQDNPPLTRTLAAGAAADNQQILMDSLFTLKRTRPMPTYSIPGLDRF